MPTTTYMSIDPRHDHGIRVPRPDLSVGTGVPNACNRCHLDKSAEWASQWAQRWYPGLDARHPPLQTAFGAFDKGDEKALSLLSKVFEDTAQSSIARASALSRAVPAMGPEGPRQIRALLQDQDPLVRRTAVEALATAPPEIRSDWLRPLLADPVKGVRMSVARWLAGVPVAAWDAKDQAQLSAIIDEYIGVQLFNADRPESFGNLGTLYADQGKWADAEAALRKAIDLAPDLATSSLNLADVYRAQGREEDARSLLRDVAAKFPGDATAQHALGLSLLRGRRLDQALMPLRRAGQPALRLCLRARPRAWRAGSTGDRCAGECTETQSSGSGIHRGHRRDLQPDWGCVLYQATHVAIAARIAWHSLTTMHGRRQG
jgi:tetratricopeptide (TPR) repeat protein